MDFDDVRQTITGAINASWVAAYPTYLVVYENQQGPNMETQLLPFITVAIEYLSGEQMAMADSNPPSRYTGYVEISLFIRTDSGTKLRNDLLDYLTNLLKTKVIGNIVFKTPRPLKPRTGIGWVDNTLHVPFHFDTHN